MKKINETSKIGDLIDASVFASGVNGFKLRSVTKHSTIFSFWKDIVGSKFEKFTKPYAIKHSTFYVSTKSPVVAQELSLYKKTLLKKINSYSMPLGLEIKNITFNYKNFDEITAISAPETEVEDKPIWLSDDSLEKIEADENEIAQIEKHIKKIKLLNDKQKKKLILKIIASKKAKIVQNTHSNG